MTAYSGGGVKGLLLFYNNSDWSVTLTGNTTPTPADVSNYSDNAGDIFISIFGAFASNVVNLNSNNYNSTHNTGVVADSGPTDGAGVGFDWFERVHVSPAIIDAGAIVADQSYTIEIHNAYRSTNRTLDTATNNVSSDVDIPALPALSDTIEALTSQTLTLVVDKDGVTEFDGTYDFTTDNGQALSVAISGLRVVLLPWIALDGMTEGVEWKTDVLRAYGQEQRRGLRAAPHRDISMQVIVQDNDRANIEGRLENQTQPFCVPLWWDLTEVGAISAGVSSITVDTSNGEYQAGSEVFIYESVSNFEAKRIDTVNANSLDLADAVANTYTDAIVVPAFTGYSTSAVISRSSKNINKASMKFSLIKHYNLADPSTTQHRSIDVLLDPSIVVAPVSLSFSQSKGLIDNGISGFKPYAKEAGARYVDNHAWLKSNEADRYAMKQWIYSRNGKRTQFFYPTWQKDFTLILQILSGATTIDVTEVQQSVNFDLMVIIKDGTIFYKQVTGKTAIAGGHRLNIDSSFGQQIEITDIDRISLMRLSRHASDRVEIQHSLPTITKAQIAVTTI